MKEKKRVVIFGGNGFIGHHLARKLKNEGHFVRTVDILKYEYGEPDYTDDYVIADLRDYRNVANNVKDVDEVYQLSAWMGGAGVIFTGENDATIMSDSALINLNTLNALKNINKTAKVFFSSSACVYNEFNQLNPEDPNCEESSAFPANPDSPYGWEKIFSEILYESFYRNHGIEIRIARFHNIFGPEACWNNGREKAPAAICRKVAEAYRGGAIDIWGDGEQTRSFLYIDECLEGIQRLMDGDFIGPVNIGSDEMVSINELVDIACSIDNKLVVKNHIPGPLGVRGRNSDNNLIKSKLNWAPSSPLKDGIEKTYKWIQQQILSEK